MNRLLLGLSIVLSTATAEAAERPITVDDLLAVKSVADPQPSPDGKHVAYVLGTIDRAANKTNRDIYVVPMEGGEPRRLTTSPGSDDHPRWSPDGKTIAFTSDRSGSSQIWLLPVDGGEARPLTKLPIDVSGPIWSPRGDKLAFAAEVYPGKSPEETAAIDKAKGEEKSKARVYDDLMIRHWASWDEGKRSHLFLCDAATGDATDLTPNLKVNTPPGPFGGSSDYCFAPDGSELAFTAEPMKDHAWSTNTDIYIVPAAGGEPRNVTEKNKGADAQPSYMPGPIKPLLVYLSQARPGFEADVWVMKVAQVLGDNIQVYSVSEYLDRPIQSFSIDQNGQSSSILAVIDDKGRECIVPISLAIVTDGPSITIMGVRTDRRLVVDGVNTAVNVSPGGRFVYLRGNASAPSEVYKADRDGHNQQQLTRHNEPLMSQLDLANPEAFTFKGADGDDVSGWLVRPPGFDRSKKYPTLLLIHGGPQGAWHDEWSARWNYQMFAAPGYAVVAINPRGSTGYGQKFTDQISTDWNGRVVEDLTKGLDFALKKYTFLDETRMAAAGGSYGGYMVNWLAGHTDRFKALISHAGIYDLTSMNSTTEELWFSEWDFGGSPWQTPERHLKQSPSTYAGSFKTPTLVIHGALDYRVPDAQGLGMYTALRRQGVPARYLWFPDEGHWILKPQNRVVWWREMYGWLDRYLKGPEAK